MVMEWQGCGYGVAGVWLWSGRGVVREGCSANKKVHKVK